LVTSHPFALPFLKKAAQAITDLSLPATAVIFNDKTTFFHLLDRPSMKILIASIEEVTPFFPSMQKIKKHQMTKLRNTIHWLPLDKIDYYLNDSSYKRILWNTLKSLPLPDLL
jgi:hypothetical protein